MALKAGWAPRLVPPLSFRLSLGLKGRAAQSAAWKGVETVTGMSSAAEAKSRPEPRTVRGGRGPRAVGRVEDEVGAVDVGADVAEVDRDALDDVGDRVRAGGVDEDFGGFGVDLQGLADDDGAEVEGADLGRR